MKAIISPHERKETTPGTTPEKHGPIRLLDPTQRLGQGRGVGLAHRTEVTEKVRRRNGDLGGGSHSKPRKRPRTWSHWPGGIASSDKKGDERHGKNSDHFRSRPEFQSDRKSPFRLRVGLRRRRDGHRKTGRHEHPTDDPRRAMRSSRKTPQSLQAPEATGNHRWLVRRCG